MKKMITALLLLAMLIQVLPFEALASVGEVLSKEELARAYALTGLGTGGLVANSNGAYHAGMKPNLSWNASQLDDWLEEKLARDLNSVEDLLSQVSFAINELKVSDPKAYERLTQSNYFHTAQALYIEAEAIRQALRSYQDRLTAASNTVAEMSRLLQEDKSGLFDSDQVRYSARIEEATREIAEIRQTIVDNFLVWEDKIVQTENYMRYGMADEDDDQFIGDWISEVLGQTGGPQTNSVSVSRVSPNASRSGRLSSAAGLAANDVADAKITVITENEVAIVFQTGTLEKPVPVEGVKVSASDALNAGAEPKVWKSNSTGTVVIPINLFKTDEFNVVHLRLNVDPTAQGFRDYVVEDMDLEKGEVFTHTLTPVNETSLGNVGDPYVHMMSFEKKDIMHKEYNMIYSPVNDHEFEIKVEVKNTEGKDLPDLLMRYYKYEKSGVGPSFDKLKECWAYPTRKEGNTYFFKGKWKQLFAPKTSKAQRPTFMFGKDAPASMTFPSQLVSQQSATEKPLNEGTGSNGGIFGNVLGKGLGFSFMIPTVEVKVNFDLPFQQYLPRLAVDPGGYVVIYVGMPMFEDAIKKSKLNWQSKDARAFQQAQKFVEREGMLANYKAQYNLAKDVYKEKAWKFFGESKFNVGIFAVLTGRWELDNDVPNVISRNVSIKGGFGVTASYSYSWTISYPIGPVPVYVCFTLGVSAGFAAEVSVDFGIVNGQFRDWRLRFVDNVTITIGFMFSGQLGVGIKGFLDAWVRLTASLDFTLRLSIMDTAPSTFTIVGALTLTVGATVFFVSFSKNWNLGEQQFWPKKNANLLDYYMNAEANDGAKTIRAASDEPYRYPALTPEMKEIEATFGQENGGSECKILRVGGRNLLFRIQQTFYNQKPVRRVYWRCLNADTDIGGLWSSTVELIQKGGHYRDLASFVLPRSDYDFDVYTDGRFVYLVATCARDFNENGYPVRNDLSMTNPDEMNMGVYYMVMEHDGKGQLKAPADDLLAGAYDTKQGYANSYMDYPKYTHDSYINPRIALATAVMKDNANKKVDHFEIYGQCETIAYSQEDTAVGTTSFAVTNDAMMLLFTDKTVKSPLGDGYERAQALSLMDLDAVGRSKHQQSMIDKYAMSFVGLSRPKDGEAGDSAIELYAYDMNRGKGDRKAVVLEKGDIGHIAMVEDRLSKEWNKSGRTVFYTLREKSADGAVRNQLHSLYIAPVKDGGGAHPSYEVTKYTYDAVIPSGTFDICYLEGAPYLYWVSTTEKQKNSDPDIWRVWTMCFDPVANTVTAPSVFAEFTIPKITYNPRDQYGTAHMYSLTAAPGSVILTGTGTAYVNTVATDWEIVPEFLRPKQAPTSLFSFKELLTPSANITAAIPRQLAIKAGDFEDVTLGVRNEGNLAISTIDIAMYEVVDGKESKEPVSTVHINAKDPNLSKVTYRSTVWENVKVPTSAATGGWKDIGTQKDAIVLTGRPAGYREEDYDITPRKRDWVLDQQTTQYTLSIGDSVGVDAKVTGASKPRHIKTDILFPGSTGSFMGAFKIPGNWHGEKTLRMKVVKATVESNLARAVANAAGLAANAPESAALEYVLNEKTGKLELQAPTQANAAVKNAIASGLYANEIDTSTADMLIEIQDVEVKHRIYEGLDDERMLDIVIHNHAANRNKLTLSCAVYVDGASDPYILNLPYYNKTSSRRTQTITLPVSALVDDVTKHKSARVVITAVGSDERSYANNEFSVYFDGDIPFDFMRQPGDTTVQEGEDVDFTVEVTGGVPPYSYQWQIYNPKTGKWVDLKGFTEPTMSREKIEKKWDGCRFRCVVTDATGAQIISQEFTLHVRDRVDTGDDSNLPLYLSVALAALALLLALRRWRRAA